MTDARQGKLVVVGQGYVGLPLAMRAVEVGYDVVGYDLDVDRIKRLADGDSYVEDISDERLGAALATGRYLPTVESEHMSGFDVAVIDVPTPLEEGNPNLAYVEAAAATLAEHLRPGATVVLESTSYPGTTEELVVPILEAGSGLTGGRDFHAGYSPERIDPGNTTWYLENTPKVVSGIDAASLEVVQTFYGRLVEHTVAVSGTREAELTKLLENTFRHVNIALVNELAMFADELGIDVWEAIDAASTKPFGYMGSPRGPAWAGTASPSTRATCRGRCAAVWASPSASWNWRTTSTSTCRTTSSAASCWRSTAWAVRSTGRVCSSSAWPTSATPGTPARRRAP